MARDVLVNIVNHVASDRLSHDRRRGHDAPYTSLTGESEGVPVVYFTTTCAKCGALLEIYASNRLLTITDEMTVKDCIPAA